MTQPLDDMIAEAIIRRVKEDSQFNKEVTASDISLAWISACNEALEAGKIDTDTRSYIETRAADLTAALTNARSKCHHGQVKH